MVQPVQSAPPKPIQPLPVQKLPVLKELKCPNCGAPLPQYNPASQTLVCGKCSSHVAIGAETPEVLSKGRKLPAPQANLKLGQRLLLDGVYYFVMGRVLYEGWEPDDTSDKWTWTEWLLGAPDGRMLWLSYDKEDGFVLFNKMRIREAFDPQSSSTIPTKDGQRATVRERYPARIIGAEGELTWRATAGERLMMVEGVGPDGKKYSVQKTAAELEVYEGKPLDSMALAKALGDENLIQSIQQEREKRKQWTIIGVMCLAFGVIGLVFGLLATGTGEPVITRDVRIDAANPLAQVPVNFDRAGRPAVIKAWLLTNLPANTAYDIDVSILSPNERETFLFDIEFWHETGRDEDGTWTEKSTYGSDTFVPYVAGPHQVEVEFAENQTMPAGGLNIRVSVLKNHILPGWLLGYGALVGILGIVFLSSSKGLSLKAILIIVVIVAVIAGLIVAGIDLFAILGDILDEM